MTTTTTKQKFQNKIVYENSFYVVDEFEVVIIDKIRFNNERGNGKLKLRRSNKNRLKNFKRKFHESHLIPRGQYPGINAINMSELILF